MRGVTKIPKSLQAYSRTSLETDSGVASCFPIPLRAIAGAFGISLAITGQALATIDSAAMASGRYGELPVQSEAAPMELPVEPATGLLSVVLKGVLDVSGGTDSQNADGGDTVMVTVTVSNTGNVALSNVRPADPTATVDGVLGAGSFGAFQPKMLAEILPGASGEFAVIYSLSDEDVYRAAGKDDALGIRVSAAAAWASGEIVAEPAQLGVAVPANPRLTIAKDATITKAEGNRGAGLEVGDIVTYTYTVTNAGNVPISDITIADEHEGVTLNSAEVASVDEGPFAETESIADPLGVSADESGPNGVWDLLGAGGAVRFTYRHIVTQAEFEAQ